MIWIADTGPIIALAKVRKLSLLRDVADEVWIPPVVHRELYGKLDEDTTHIEKALSSFIEVHDAAPIEDGRGVFLAGLDAGERQVLELALTAGSCDVVLMDDFAGREVAKRLGLRVIGTIGLLCEAKKCGRLSGVVPLLKRMRKNGYWLADEAIDVARQLAGE